MIEYETTAATLMRSDSRINAVAIIEEGNKIPYSTYNWTLRKDIENITEAWNLRSNREIEMLGNTYKILQSTSDRIVTILIEKNGDNVELKESIIGVRDNERIIMCRIAPDPDLDSRASTVSLFAALTEIFNALMNLSNKKPYKDDSEEFGKREESEKIKLKILSHTALLLQKIGLEKFGLSSDEAKVYLALLEKGEKGNTVGNLSSPKLGIKRTTIYAILDRLVEDDWVKKALEPSRGAARFIARPLDDLIDKVVREKEEELKILKSFRFLMSESHEENQAGTKKTKKDSQIFKWKSFNFETLGITGMNKDSGLISFEFDEYKKEEILDDTDLIKSTLKFFTDKMDYEIKANKNPDFEDLKIEPADIKEYNGAVLSIKFKEGSSTANNVGNHWIIAAKIVAIPRDNKIFVIWGNKEKFQVLIDMILKLK